MREDSTVQEKSTNPAGNYLLKVNNRNTRTRCEICSKLTIKTPERCHWQMISFNVKSLFTNVSLNDTMDILLRNIYLDKEINTNLTKKELKEPILLCTKCVHFTYNNLMYKHVDSLVMECHFGLILAGIFMVELERIISNLKPPP